MSSGPDDLQAFRGAFLDFVADPFYHPEADCARYIPDGLLVVHAGRIRAFGPYADLRETFGHLPTTAYRQHLILPGFIDTHVHYPQTGMIAAYGEQLLTWLNRYTFPVESQFHDTAHARRIASFFLDELLKHGTTTALVFCTVHPASVDAFFEEAERRNLCMIAGKVMMDRNAPPEVCDTAASSYQETRSLIQKWHGRGRLRYAVTPRFAPTSTPEQLRRAGQLLEAFSDVYLHTHLSETEAEIAWVRELFPDCERYLDVYDQAGLVTNRSVFAHGVHLSEGEFGLLSERGSAIAHCPTSNLFLGSGLFPLHEAVSQHSVKVGIGTDVGGGTSFSLLRTLSEAYKVAQLRGQTLSPLQALFLMTLGGARALNLGDRLGSFDVGKDADFVVLNPQATPLLTLRSGAELPKSIEGVAEQVFALIMLGDERAVQATYILGEA